MSRAKSTRSAVAGVALALALGACASPQVGSPCPIPEKATAEQQKKAFDACFGAQIGQPWDARVSKDVDILFMIDNSRSMAPKQLALAQNIPKFMATIEGFNANYHVGVTTSDVGSTIADGQVWSAPEIAECNTFKGDDGKLQMIPCTSSKRFNLSPDAKSACSQLCTNPNFANSNQITSDGANYISKIDGKTNVPQDLVSDGKGGMVDQGPATAFKCIGLVGDGGCGIEGQLEGASRALDGHLTENSGFRRNNAVLAVIFITDEDDCSVQLARRNENSPVTRDCPTPDQSANFDCFGFDYRCLARSIQCDQPMNAEGTKTNCHERPDNYLETTKKYHDFFAAQVPTLDKLVISGIWTQPSITSGGQVIITHDSTGTTTPFLNRAQGSGASCRYLGSNANYLGVFGQAQRRLSDFASTFGLDTFGNPISIEKSICDIDNYATALDDIAKRIGKSLGVDCLPGVPKGTDTNTPACLVGDVDSADPLSSPSVYLPVCSQTCCNGWATSANPVPEDPTVAAACSAETKDCYCAVKTTQPMVCSASVGVVGGVWRRGEAPPTGKVVNFRCASGG